MENKINIARDPTIQREQLSPLVDIYIYICLFIYNIIKCICVILYMHIMGILFHDLSLHLLNFPLH